MIINFPNDLLKMQNLKIGDQVLYSGIIYTARDAAHMRIEQMLKNKLPLPFDLNNSIIYYAGPTPTKPSSIIGSIGPTTSSRMDIFSYMMPVLGVIATIGKGPRDLIATETYKKNKTMYFITTGGIGALLSKCVISAEEIAFSDLGPESIKKLVVKNFPLIVGIDYQGNDIFRR